MDTTRFSTGPRKFGAKLSQSGRAKGTKVVVVDAAGNFVGFDNSSANRFRSLVRDVAQGKSMTLGTESDTLRGLIAAGLVIQAEVRGKKRFIVPGTGRTLTTKIVNPTKVGRSEKSSASNRSAVTDFEAEANRLHIPLGIAPSDDEAYKRLRIVAADADDIFSNSARAMEFLTTKPLDGKGRTGVQILREKGLPGIISSLDDLRFGSQG